MKIWLVVTGEPTPIDDGNPRLYRVGILSEELARRGHDVTWWTGNTYHQKAIQRSDKTEIHDLKEQGYRLVLLNGMLYTSKVSLKRIINHIQNALEFVKLSKTQDKPDVIFCCYPPIELSYAVSRYAKKHGIPIILDFRDKWPDVIEENMSCMKKFLGFPIIAFWRYAQKYALKHATAITGITDAYIEWALSKINRPRTSSDPAFHLAVNPVSPDIKEIEEAQKFWNNHDIIQREKQVIGCFTGMLSNRLDLVSLVKGALLLTPEEQQNIKLVFCGVGDAKEDLEKLAGNAPHILFAGWRSAAELRVLLDRSDFGLLPYYSTDDFMTSYPNKFGEYLSCGLPIYSCLKGISEKLITENNIGHMIEEENPESYAEALRHAIQNKDNLKQTAPKAKQVYDDMFNGKKIYPALGDYIESFVKQSS